MIVQPKAVKGVGSLVPAGRALLDLEVREVQDCVEEDYAHESACNDVRLFPHGDNPDVTNSWRRRSRGKGATVKKGHSFEEQLGRFGHDASWQRWLALAPTRLQNSGER